MNPIEPELRLFSGAIGVITYAASQLENFGLRLPMNYVNPFSSFLPTHFDHLY